MFKRACDIYFGVVALPLVVILSFVLLILNPFFNPGPLFFRQERMGRGGVPFQIWKFRTMAPANGARRRHDEGVEEDRISRLGGVLRKSRLDELPNFINVLRGDMSVIGPRPDIVEHALAFSVSVPRYRDRFRVKPGITGLAQVRHGYADNASAVRRKARNDAIYIERGSIGMDLAIIARTVQVMLTGFGAR
ncbi:sugar transferase [Roseibacterium sp. SDUM158016]|uniref:sugar transferase n=1 Tax=Roseicyclus sediminis TaxID=2980997 RepID=UPI0021CE1395|nr:sugar transferase [Roseibacterium sp. SDUM158016]MCU4653748.1 sugar transferase [Roseibacterium sp. SDUM158016]